MLNHTTSNRANLFVVGVAKSGSSWLHFYLDSSPDIFMSKQCELHYFGEKYPKDLEWYQSNFPFEKKFKYFGESTPIYFRRPEIAKQIKEYSPEAKILVIIRDPIDRLLSHIYYAKQLGNIEEKKSLDDIVDNLKQQSINDSHYEKYLPAFEDCFGKENFKIISLEESKNNLNLLSSSLCNFLNIDNKFSIEFSKQRRNATGSKMFRLIYRNTIRPIKLKQPNLYKYLLKNKFMKFSKEYLLRLLGQAKKEPVSDKLYKRLYQEFLPTYRYLIDKGFEDIYQTSE